MLTWGRKKRMTKRMLWLLSAYCCDPHFTLQSSGLLQTDCFKGRRRLAENVFRHYLPSSFFCHAIERSVKSRYHGNNISGSQKMGSFSNNDGDGNKKGKKAIGTSAKQQLCICITLFCTFLQVSSHCKCAIRNFLISHARFKELVNTARKIFFFSF